MAKRNNTLDNYFSKKTKTDFADGGQVIEQSNVTRFEEEKSCCEPMSDPLKSGAVPVSQASTDSAYHEQDLVHGPKLSVNFIEIGPFQPVISFPASDSRKFRKDWYAIYEWLEYSPALDRAFCFTCRAFGEFKTDTFQVTGFGSWKKATEKFNEHQKSSVHISAGLKMKSYQQTRKTGSTATQISSEHAKKVDENREYLKKKPCETLLFCCRSCIALRGHGETDESQNRGNFLELMDLRATASQLIDRLFKKRERSYNYVHSKHQNELINIMAGQLKNDIIQRVHEAGIFPLIADETQDISRHEQVAVVLRYVDGDLAVHESFIGFHRTDRTDGESLAILLKNVLTSLNLDISNVRAQCYDGAASMQGTYCGVAARISGENPLAMYVHCHSHILNLCIVDVCHTATAVRHMLANVQSLYNFIEGSANEMLFLSLCKNETATFPGKSTKLKPLSNTRWSCRAEALKAILDNFETIVDTLSEISENDVRIGGQVSSLLTSITDFHFLFPCILMRRVLMQCNVLSKALQSSTLHYATVKNLVSATISALLAMRTDHHFQQLWEFTVELCDKSNYRSPQRPWRRTKKATIPGPNADSAQDHYKELHFSVLDNTVNEIRERFQENDMNTLTALNNILSSSMCTTEDLTFICHNYGFPEEETSAELSLFNAMSTGQASFDERLSLFKESKLVHSLVNVGNLFKLFLTVPMNSASCKRNFSCLRRLKTYVRNTMSQERLSDIAVLNIERNIHIDLKTVNRFGAMPGGCCLALH